MGKKPLIEFDATNPKHQQFSVFVQKNKHKAVKWCQKKGFLRDESEEVVAKAIWETLWPFLEHLPLDKDNEMVKVFWWAVYNHRRNRLNKHHQEKSIFSSLNDSQTYEVDPLIALRKIAVHKALGRLSEGDRNLAWKVLAEGAKIKEVAAQLNLPTWGVGRRMDEIKRRLRAMLQDFARD